MQAHQNYIKIVMKPEFSDGDNFESYFATFLTAIKSVNDSKCGMPTHKNSFY